MQNTQINKKKTRQPNRKMGKSLEWTFHRSGHQMVNMHLESCSLSILNVDENHIEVPLHIHKISSK